MSNKNLSLLIVCLLLAGIVAVNLLDEQQTAVPQRSDPGASRSIQTVAAVTRLHAGTTSHRSLHFAATRTLHAASIRSGIGSFHSALPPAVDPPLFFSTYLSGRGAESGVTLAFDAEGNIYRAMKKFVIEREIPGAGAMTPEDRIGEVKTIIDPATAEA